MKSPFALTVEFHDTAARRWHFAGHVMTIDAAERRADELGGMVRATRKRDDVIVGEWIEGVALPRVVEIETGDEEEAA